MTESALAVNPTSALMFLFWLWFVLTGVVLAVIDVRIHRLPNVLVGLTFVIGSLLLFVHGLLIHSLSQFTSAALGAVTLVLAYGVLHLLGGIGMGDVKYAGVVGLYLGSLSWSALWWGTLVAFLLAASASFWPASIGQKRSDRGMAFGPAMVVGALAGALISSRDG